jgi:hypothetical protein
MIAIGSAAKDSVVVDNRQRLQSMTPTFVAVVYQLRVLIRAASCKIEHQFATFADVPYHDPLSRKQWEQLWRADPQ